MMKAVYRWFENWVYPFREPADLRPPFSVGGFIWHYVGQAKLAFFAMLIIGGIAPLVEAGLFYFVGRLVDILDQVAEDDKVVTRKTISGTHLGQLFDIEPTGKAIKIDVIDIVRLKEGQYFEHWGINTLQQVIAVLKQGA